MPFVVDASVVASWLLPDERQAAAMRAFVRLDTDQAIAPSLWWFEIRNLFITSERRGRLNSQQTATALALLAELPIRLDSAPREGPLLQAARHHRLTVYDAAYLELAQREHLPLATLDRALAAAARAEGVSLIA